MNCYCGSTVSKLYTGVSQCEGCQRWWGQSPSNGEWYLLVPWRKPDDSRWNGQKAKAKELVTNARAARGTSQVSVQWYCPRCNFAARFDGEKHRLECSNCGLGFFVKSEGIPAEAHRLKSARASTIRKVIEAEDAETEVGLIKKLQGIKDAMQGIEEEVL